MVWDVDLGYLVFNYIVMLFLELFSGWVLVFLSGVVECVLCNLLFVGGFL